MGWDAPTSSPSLVELGKVGAFSPFSLLGGLIGLVFVVFLFIWYFYIIACLFAVILSISGFRGSLYLIL